MVLIHGKLIWLATPRTASRLVGNLFEEQVPGVWRSGCRHEAWDKVPKSNFPIWTFTRNPIRHIRSWYAYDYDNKDFRSFNEDRSRQIGLGEYIHKPFNPLPGFEPGRLNIYDGLATHFWPLEWGIKKFFEYIGYPNVKVPRETFGASSAKNVIIEFQDRRDSYQIFEKDWKLYNLALKRDLRHRV